MSEHTINENELLEEGIGIFSGDNPDPSFMNSPFSQVQALGLVQAPTNPEWIKVRNVGGKDLSYVSGDVVTRMLNKAFRYKWSFYIIETRVVESQDKSNKYKPDVEPVPQLPVIQVHGRLVVPGWGIREQWGAQPLSGGSDVQEHAFKSASTDALKKCASMFGIALDLYGQEGMGDLSVTPNDFLMDDAVYFENMKANMKKARAKAKAAQAQTEPIEEPTPALPEVAVEEKSVEPAIFVQPVVAPSVTKTYTVDPPINNAIPVVDQQPIVQNTAPQWQTEDILGLREAKKKLEIAEANNEGLNVYTQEFFGMPEATYHNITPLNVKDFLHFLSSK